MKKYWQIFSISWQNGFVYPVSVLFWRLRQFLLTFMSLTIWTVIFTGHQQAFGYTQKDMIAYVFLVGFLQSVILATVLTNLGSDIYTGQISNTLLKPINLFATLAAQDIADKLKNFGFIIVETVILFLIFKPSIVFPPLTTLLIFIFSALLGAVLLFSIMLLFGTLGFWTPDTWAPRFLFYMFIDFTAGKLYPLNIFPPLLQKILFLTPFPYLSYIQTQIFIGKYTLMETAQNIFILIAWIVTILFLFRFFWERGLKEYGALGR